MKYFTQFLFLGLLIIFSCFFAFANDFTVSSETILAMSHPNYLVTAGDVYTLAYIAGSTGISQKLVVDASYKMRVSNLAIIDVEGKTFLELKTLVEQIISKNYPMSGVQFVLTAPSVFFVTVSGEVERTIEKKAGALSRLSSIVLPVVTKFSSIRDVQIISRDGSVKTYDLFKAEREGDLSQDPYVRPGDSIKINKASKIIKIDGAVERPGTYQLLENEQFNSLVQYYGAGLVPLADSSRIELVRYIGSESASGNKFVLNNDDLSHDFALQHLDTVTIPLVSDLSPVMFIEGAVSVPVGSKLSPNTEISSRITVRFTKGENYASLVRRYKNEFTSASDTAHAYIIRNDTHIPLDLNPMLYDASYYSDYFVEKNDVLLIPFRQFFVTVTGAVKAPGRYPYLPDRDWAYYVTLAGGFNPLINARESVIIKDVFGNKRTKKDPILPETYIEAKQNSFLFYFGQYSPVIVTTLGIITSTFAVKALLQGR